MTLRTKLLGAGAALLLSTGAALAVPATAQTDLNVRSGPGTAISGRRLHSGRRDRGRRTLHRKLVPGELRRRLGLREPQLISRWAVERRRSGGCRGAVRL